MECDRADARLPIAASEDGETESNGTPRMGSVSKRHFSVASRVRARFDFSDRSEQRRTVQWIIAIRQAAAGESCRAERKHSG